MSGVGQVHHEGWLSVLTPAGNPSPAGASRHPNAPCSELRFRSVTPDTYPSFWPLTEARTGRAPHHDLQRAHRALDRRTDLAPRPVAREAGADGRQEGVRPRPVWGLHRPRPRRRPTRRLVPDARCQDDGRELHDDRGAVGRRAAASDAAGIHRRRRAPLRQLHTRTDHPPWLASGEGE